MTHSLTSPDLINHLLQVQTDNPIHALRQRRDKVLTATQGSYDVLLGTDIDEPTQAERLAIAQQVAQDSGAPILAQWYAQEAASSSAEHSERLPALLAFARALAIEPADAGQAALDRLQANSLSVSGIIALAQLIAFVSYQARLLIGVHAIAQTGEPHYDASNASETEASQRPWPAPNAPALGEALQINGYVNRAMTWNAWLPVVSLDTASPTQLDVLDNSHPKAKTSDYYLLLAHQPEALRQRQVAFNAIMYAPGGLSRAERELAACAASRINRCAYCTSVHAERFEQLAKRNDVIAQIFHDPDQAGTTTREQAIIQASLTLTRDPANFSATNIRALRQAGLDDLETLDLIHAVAVFGWANRLMLNLGAPDELV